MDEKNSDKDCHPKIMEKKCRSCNEVYKFGENFLKTTRWRVSDDRLWYNCNCGSTLLVNNKSVERKKADQ